MALRTESLAPRLARACGLCIAAVLLVFGGCQNADHRPEATATPPVDDPGFALPDEFSRRVATYMDGWGKQWPTFKVHGCTAVFVDGEQHYGHAWGQRDLARQMPHELDDAFELGTLSIHLTHAATLALLRDGKLTPQTAAAQHLEMPVQPSITVEHLLTMTSGLPNFTESLFFERIYKPRPATNRALAELFVGDPLEFEPGSDFAPSLSNAVVLGLVIEQVTGLDYPSAVKELVLDPLGMRDTHYGRQPGASVGLAFNEAEYLDPVVDVDPASLGAAGAWTSTAGDLAKLYTAMLEPGAEPTAAHALWGDNDLQRPYGFLATSIGDRDAYAWVGRFDGHEHGLVIVPRDGLVVLHLANTAVAPGTDIAESIAAMVYDLPVGVREEARPVPLDPASFAEMAGHWELRDSDLELVESEADQDTLAAIRSVETRFVESQGLVLQIRGRPAKRMHPTAPRSFFFKDRPQSTARFTGPRDAPVLVLERGGGSLHYRRIEAGA